MNLLKSKNLLRNSKTMKSKILTILLTLFAVTATAQSLTLAELQNFCKSSNWQTCNDILTQKGWEFHGSSKGDNTHYSTIEFAFSKSGWNGDYANAWLTLYIDGSQVEKVWYQAPKTTFNTIKNSLSANGYKSTDNKIEDGDITTYYTGKTFDIKLTTSTANNQYGGKDAVYRITISRKN